MRVSALGYNAGQVLRNTNPAITAQRTTLHHRRVGKTLAADYFHPRAMASCSSLVVKSGPAGAGLPLNSPVSPSASSAGTD